MLWRIFKYIGHLFHLRHRKGHGIHSPYLFEFLSRVIFNSEGVECPLMVRQEHRALKKDLTPAGGEGRSVRSFVRHSSVSEKQAALLHRIARWFHPEMMVELGTGLGISTLYLLPLPLCGPEPVLHHCRGDFRYALYPASREGSWLRSDWKRQGKKAGG